MIRAIITGYKDKRLLALKDEKGFISFKLYDGSALGTIINGRVDKRVENLNACFVRLSAQEYGYLPTSEIKASTIVPVQIVKEGKGDKKYLLTRQLSIAGRYAVIFKDADKPVLFSKRISTEGKGRILEELKAAEPLSYPVLFRFNSARAEFPLVLEEVRKLMDMGFTSEDVAMKGIGYKEIIDAINSGKDAESARYLIKQNSRHYAKRQITWFKRYEQAEFIEV